MNEAATKLGLRLFGLTAEQAKARGICVRCKDQVVRTALSEIDRREYAITAICPECWAELFPEDEEDDGDDAG